MWHLVILSVKALTTEPPETVIQQTLEIERAFSKAHFCRAYGSQSLGFGDMPCLVSVEKGFAFQRIKDCAGGRRGKIVLEKCVRKHEANPSDVWTISKTIILCCSKYQG